MLWHAGAGLARRAAASSSETCAIWFACVHCPDQYLFVLAFLWRREEGKGEMTGLTMEKAPYCPCASPLNTHSWLLLEARSAAGWTFAHYRARPVLLGSTCSGPRSQGPSRSASLVRSRDERALCCVGSVKRLSM